MILSSRPTDRRQLIEEAAGVTKYKARRRAAELKLEAAQQNLTRIDDIVFEVEKQRGTLKRQAAKARRYQKLRDELRRWEKVLFARKYRQLAETIESARGRLDDAREREAAAAARVAEVESNLGRLRIELVEAESRATRRPRGGARARAGDQPPAAADRLRPRAGRRRSARAIDARWRPELDDARGAARAGARRARRTARGGRRGRCRARSRRRGAGLGVGGATRPRTARSKGSRPTSRRRAARCSPRSTPRRRSATRSSTPASARDRVAETLSKLDVEADDVRIESERVGGRARGGRRRAAPRPGRARGDAHRARRARVGAGQRAHRARVARALGARARAGAGRARGAAASRSRSSRPPAPATATRARAVLAQANGKVEPAGRGRRLPRGRRRATSAPSKPASAICCSTSSSSGRSTPRPASSSCARQDAGRCGFLIASSVGGAVRRGVRPDARSRRRRRRWSPLSSVVRVNGPFAGAIRRGDRRRVDCASSYERAPRRSRARRRCPVATLDGDVFRGPHLVTRRQPGRGARHPRDQARDQGAARAHRRRARSARPPGARRPRRSKRTIAHASAAIAALNAEHHRQEKAIVGLEAQLQHAADEDARARAEGRAAGARAASGRGRARRRSIGGRTRRARRSSRSTTSSALADERLTVGAAPPVRGARGGRGPEPPRGRSAARRTPRWSSARRRSPPKSQRLEEASAELEVARGDARGRARRHARAASRSCASPSSTAKRSSTRTSARSTRCGRRCRRPTRRSPSLRVASRRASRRRSRPRAARSRRSRALVSELDVARATAESDLAHLAHSVRRRRPGDARRGARRSRRSSKRRRGDA